MPVLFGAPFFREQSEKRIKEMLAEVNRVGMSKGRNMEGTWGKEARDTIPREDIDGGGLEASNQNMGEWILKNLRPGYNIVGKSLYV